MIGTFRFGFRSEVAEPALAVPRAVAPPGESLGHLRVLSGAVVALRLRPRCRSRRFGRMEGPRRRSLRICLTSRRRVLGVTVLRERVRTEITAPQLVTGLPEWTRRRTIAASYTIIAPAALAAFLAGRHRTSALSAQRTEPDLPDAAHS